MHTFLFETSFALVAAIIGAISTYTLALVIEKGGEAIKPRVLHFLATSGVAGVVFMYALKYEVNVYNVLLEFLSVMLAYLLIEAMFLALPEVVKALRASSADSDFRRIVTFLSAIGCGCAAVFAFEHYGVKAALIVATIAAPVIAFSSLGALYALMLSITSLLAIGYLVGFLTRGLNRLASFIARICFAS